MTATLPMPTTMPSRHAIARPGDPATATDASGRMVSVDVPAKTNLILHVGAAHAEWGGRHELDTVYCGIGVYDTVTLTAKEPGAGFSLDLSGAHLGNLAASASDMRRNHAVLALFALAEACGHAPDVAISLEKRIPVAAGLGGGSADAAGTLLGLNELWGLHWPLGRLRQVAAGLGADMPFCLSGGYARGRGFGERIEEITEGDRQGLVSRGLAGMALIGAYRDELSTPQVYAEFDRLGASPDSDNHLQRAAIALHPRSGQAIHEARLAGASQALVSGSGPSVVAFVPDDRVAAAVQRAWTESGAVDRIIAAQTPATPAIRVSQCR